MGDNKKISNIYAFIDSQNLNLGIQSQGWHLDWRKFRQYLGDKYHVLKVFLFIGYVAGNEQLYAHLQTWGYIIIFKPTLELPEGKVKGNVDAELVLHTMIQYQNFDKAVIVSGDGDFYCLVEYLIKQKKLLRLLAPNTRYSSLYRKFSKYVLLVNQLKNSLEYKKTGIRGRSKP
jgi:uncharacterized LabA/DUF88 family protein